MLDFRSNLYKGEWLDLVFAGRNKSYGAYELRQHYSSRLLLALFLASVLFVGGIAGPLAYRQMFKDTVITCPIEDPVRVLEVALPQAPAREPERVIEPQRAQQEAAPAQQHARTEIFVPPVVVPEHQAPVEMASQAELEHAIVGTETLDGPAADPGVNGPAAAGPGGTGTGSDPSEGDAYKTIDVLEVLPSFPGGEAAFAKFLGKNIRYPSSAQDAGIHGKVFVSFIVERDGRLSEIIVDRGLGYGCDEEVIRVMKKAPAWRPGIQNGHAVRVKYTIPVSFNISE